MTLKDALTIVIGVGVLVLVCIGGENSLEQTQPVLSAVVRLVALYFILRVTIKSTTK